MWGTRLNERLSELRRTTENTSRLTTNQKVAGSSPAERAPESSANAGIASLRINLKVGLCHLTHHLAFSERLRRVPEGAIWMFQLLTQSGNILQPLSCFCLQYFERRHRALCVPVEEGTGLDHLKPAARHLDFAEQRAESYNEIISEVRIKCRSSLKYPWEQD
jgi:hypothetical protein